MKKGNTAIAAVLAMAVVFAMWLLWAYWGASTLVMQIKSQGKAELQDLGQLGDVFGGVNALFSALALIGVGFAAFFQIRTFHLVQEQQAAERADRLVGEAQHREQMQQQYAERFQTVFFQLLDWVERTRVHTIRWQDEEMSVRTFATRFVQVDVHAVAGSTKHRVDEMYRLVYQSNEAVLGVHFRSRYHLFKHILESNLPVAEQVRYANLARATFDPYDTILLMVNCATWENTSFKPLVEGFGLLKLLPERGPTDSELALVSRHLAGELFSPSATMSAEERRSFWMKSPDLVPEGFGPHVRPSH